MAAKKRGRKAKKRGRKRGAARASTAVRVGSIVTRKLSPAVLKKRGLALKVRQRKGKKVYEVIKRASIPVRLRKDYTPPMFRKGYVPFEKRAQVTDDNDLSWSPEELRRRQSAADKEIAAMEDVMDPRSGLSALYGSG